MSIETILHAFLSRESLESRERLLKFLSPSGVDQINRLSSFKETLNLEQPDNEDLLKTVHWSWFLPTLKSYTHEEQSLFLSVLDPSLANHLANEIPCKFSNTPISGIGIDYLRRLLLNSLLGEHNRLIPNNFLPPSPLNQLLGLSKKELVALIGLLSMYDLAAEIRQIVETKILKNIYSCLTEMERNLLKQVCLKPESYSLPKIGLERWDGNRETLRLILHRRGLSRLGLALSGEDPALIWYLCHHLDIGRGSSLFKLCIKESAATTIEAAALQVKELLADG